MKKLVFILCLISGIVSGQALIFDNGLTKTGNHVGMGGVSENIIDIRMNTGQGFFINLSHDGFDGFFVVVDTVHDQQIIFGNGSGLQLQADIPNENFTESSFVTKHYVDRTHPILKELASDPVNPVPGFIYYNPNLHKIRVYINGAWFSLLLE